MKFVPIRQEVTVTKSATGLAATELTDFSGKLGYLTRVSARAPVGTNCTTVSLYIIPENTSALAIAAAPDELDVAYKATAIDTTTKSDTLTKVDDRFTPQSQALVAQESKRKWYALCNFTAGGADPLTLVVAVEGFMLVR